MALLRLSALVTSMVGKLGGSYFSTKKGSTSLNRCGSKLTKADSGKVAVQSARTIFSSVASSWKTLNDDQKLAWTTSAGTKTFYNKANLPYTPSGYEYFCYCNMSLVSSAAFLKLVPSIATPAMLMKAINIGFDLAHTNLIFEYEAPPIPNQKIINIYASAPNSLGSSRPRGGYKKLVFTYVNAVNASLNLNSYYESVFGYLPATGKIFLKMEVVDLLSGDTEGSKLTKADSGFA